MFWRVHIYDAAWQNEVPLPRQTLTFSAPIAELDQFSRYGDGDCFEGQLTALSKGLQLKPGDTIELQLSLDGNIWKSFWSGTLVRPGYLASADLSEIQAAGLRKLLFHREAPQEFIPAADVAQQARFLVTYRPYDIRFDPQYLPDLNISGGLIEPNFAMIGELLDKLASQVPGFEVLEGSTYTYQGRVYQPGEWVEPVTWGVLPTRHAFFRRAMGVLDVREDDPDVTLEAQEPDWETKVTAVRFVFGQTSENGLIWNHRTGLRPYKSFRATSSAARSVGYAAKVVPIADGPHHITNLNSIWSLEEGQIVSGSTATLSNPFGQNETVILGRHYVVDSDTPAPSDVGVIKLTALVPHDDFVDGFYLERDSATRVIWAYSDQDANVPAGGLDGAVLEDGYLWTRQESGPGWRIKFTIFIVTESPFTEVRFKKLYLFKLRRQFLRHLARSYYKIPDTETYRVTHRKPFELEPQPRVRITLKDGRVVTQKAARWDYEITKEGGFELHIDPEEVPADEAGEAALTEELGDRQRRQALNYMGAFNAPEYRPGLGVAPTSIYDYGSLEDDRGDDNLPEDPDPTPTEPVARFSVELID